MKKLLFSLLGLLQIAFLNAQDSVNKGINPFQISLITPMGTNGIEATNISNQLSINIFAGYNGGVNGLELAGFANILKGDLKGLQASGFLNANMGNSQGAQFAGFSNFTKRQFNGGIQGSGFLNVVGADAQIVQAAGFLNVVNGKTTGLQMAGFSNVSRGVKGAQISGFANFNVGEFKGIQSSGFANFNAGSLKGVQISGFLNMAGNVNGFQIGIVNYCHEIENGVPIGLVSIVKNGFREFEIGGNESLYTTLSYRTGHRKFYNIISAGTSIRNNTIIWGFGYGVGSSFKLSEKLGMNLELITYHINEDEPFSDYLNNLNKLNLTLSYPLSKTVQAYFGPTFNVLLTENETGLEESTSASIVPWSFFDKTYKDNTRIAMYPGFTLGIRFKKNT